MKSADLPGPLRVTVGIYSHIRESSSRLHSSEPHLTPTASQRRDRPKDTAIKTRQEDPEHEDPEPSQNRPTLRSLTSKLCTQGSGLAELRQNYLIATVATHTATMITQPGILAYGTQSSVPVRWRTLPMGFTIRAAACHHHRWQGAGPTARRTHLSWTPGGSHIYPDILKSPLLSDFHVMFSFHPPSSALVLSSDTDGHMIILGSHGWGGGRATLRATKWESENKKRRPNRNGRKTNMLAPLTGK